MFIINILVDFQKINNRLWLLERTSKFISQEIQMASQEKPLNFTNFNHNSVISIVLISI